MAEMIKKEDKITIYRSGDKVLGIDYRTGKTVSIYCDTDNALALDKCIEEALERLTNISGIAIGDTVMLEDWATDAVVRDALFDSYAISRRCARYATSHKSGSDLIKGNRYKVIDKVWFHNITVMVVEDIKTTQIFYVLPASLRRVDDEI